MNELIEQLKARIQAASGEFVEVPILTAEEWLDGLCRLRHMMEIELEEYEPFSTLKFLNTFNGSDHVRDCEA